MGGAPRTRVEGATTRLVLAKRALEPSRVTARPAREVGWPQLERGAVLTDLVAAAVGADAAEAALLRAESLLHLLVESPQLITLALRGLQLLSLRLARRHGACALLLCLR